MLIVKHAIVKLWPHNFHLSLIVLLLKQLLLQGMQKYKL